MNADQVKEGLHVKTDIVQMFDGIRKSTPAQRESKPDALHPSDPSFYIDERKKRGYMYTTYKSYV